MQDQVFKIKDNSSESSQHSDQFDSQKEEQNAFTSSYRQYYLFNVGVIDKNSEEFMENLSMLRKNGFEFSKQFSFKFQRTIVNSWKDSVKYEIQYGNFKTFISASLTSYDFKAACRQQISRGNFGRIVSFNYKYNPLVAKSFYYDSINAKLDFILREIFWVKFASILGIGPQFITIYGFDMISLKNTCEFLMQECLSFRLKQDNQINQQTIKQRMKIIIRTLHSFHAIHGDIKLSHIAWSSRQKKIIIIDFGMSQFIKEQIGQKTLTQYFGTFPYSCREMKKAYTLKSSVYVDLFFNDLYALQECFEKFKSQMHYPLIKRQTRQSQSKWKLVVGLFRFKFEILNNNARQAINLYQQFPELAKCFRLIINIEQKEDPLHQFTTYFWSELKDQMKQSFSQQFGQQKKISFNEIMYMEIMKSSKKSIFCNLQISASLIKNMFKNQTLGIFLDSDKGQESMFEFLFERKKLSRSQIKIKLKVAKCIFLTKNLSLSIKDISRHQTSRFVVRSVLLMFQDYFYKAGNLEKLESIEDIFRLSCQFKYLKKVQQNICEVFLKNSDLWFDRYRKGIATLFNQHTLDTFVKYNKNPRSSWEWLTTFSYLQQEFLSDNNKQLIQSCTRIIREIDRKISSIYLNLKYDEEGFFEALRVYEEQLVKKEGSKKNNFERVQLQGEQFLLIGGDISSLKNRVLSLQTCLAFGIYKSKQQKSFLCFSQTLTCLFYILRKTVWQLAFHHKFNELALIEGCLEEFFEDTFISDMAQGVNIFVIFSSILFKAAQNSEKIKRILVNFLRNINMKTILHQIAEDGCSLELIIINFLQISKKYTEDGFDEQQVKLILDSLFDDLNKFFFENADKWWAVPESEVNIVLKIAEVYYPALKNSSQLEIVGKMISFAEEIINKQYNIELLCFVITIISNIISIQSFENSIDLIWKILNKIQDKTLMFSIIERNPLIFQAIINQMCNDFKFQECLNLLEQYGRQLVVQSFIFFKYINNQCIKFFSDFVDHLPDDVAYKMFIDKLDTFQLKRIKQSPRLAFILIFLLDNKRILLKDKEKSRFIKLISFGLSKITIRYNYHIEINGRLLHFHRLFIQFKSNRKQFIHLQHQGRVSHDQILINQLKIQKQKRCRKMIIKAEPKKTIKQTLLSKCKLIAQELRSD